MSDRLAEIKNRPPIVEYRLKHAEMDLLTLNWKDIRWLVAEVDRLRGWLEEIDSQYGINGAARCALEGKPLGYDYLGLGEYGHPWGPDEPNTSDAQGGPVEPGSGRESEEVG